jgi:DNA invertase Pin-like site-specific DNA recombinase
MISARTRAALAAAKAKGTVLGNPRLADARAKARATHIARRPAAPIVGMIAEWASKGVSFREIARRLNALNIRPGRGIAWYGSSVKNQLSKAA